MTNLDPVADKVVREAVDAFIEGRLPPELSAERAGETAFETKNSRYRLIDGVVVAAPDDSLIGSELVGWLIESARRSVVESAWQPGSRAVLVDRGRGRNIIVTSTTRLLHLERRAPAGYQAGATLQRAPKSEPPAPLESFSPHVAPIIAATPLPSHALPAAWPTPVESAAQVQRRAAAIHLPPRPLTARAEPTPLPQPARPLPAPTPPPQRGVPTPFPVQVKTEPQPADGTPWELTSGEFEMEDAELTRADSTHYDASRDEPSYPVELWTPEGAPEAPEGDDAADLGEDAPIPLVRPSRPHR
jgi:hypothetical protein